MSTAPKTAFQNITFTKGKETGADFIPLLYNKTASEDINAYDKANLAISAKLALDALMIHKNDECLVQIDNSSVKRETQNISVITLINNNKPFLLSSVLGCLKDFVSSLYLVAHPILDVKHSSNAITVTDAIGTNKPDEDMQRISVMQIHLNQLDEEQSQSIIQELQNVLNQVDKAVRDWQPMVNEVEKLIQTFKKPIPKLKTEACDQIVDFLTWLKDNNFTFLGLRQYDFHPNKEPSKAFEIRDLALGILDDRSVRVIGDPSIEEVPEEILSFMKSDAPIVITKATTRSRVHRPVWLDYIGIKLYDNDGNVNGEIRLTGLFTATAYNISVMRIPYLKEKVQTVIKALGYNIADHSGKALINILESYPRDDMFRIDVNTLSEHARLILELGERPRIRALTLPDPFGRFVSALIYIPRDHFDSATHVKIGKYLLKTFGGDFYESHPQIFDNALIRIHFVVHRKGANAVPNIKRETLENDIIVLASNWEDLVQEAAGNQFTAQEISLASHFSPSYQNMFSHKDALKDAHSLLTLSEKEPIEVVFYHHIDDSEIGVSLKLFHQNSALVLSERVPLLENMGFKVIAEQTFELPDGKGGKAYLHDMQLDNAFGKPVDLEKYGQLLSEAFKATWKKEADNDGFNALTQTAELDWRKIVVLRSYGRYLQQIGIPYTQNRVAEALNRYPLIAKNLYQLFALRFDPKLQTKDSIKLENELQNEIEIELQSVPSLDDDQIIRRYRNLIAATLRTNAFSPEADGQPRRTLALKLDPHAVDGLPDPKPYREIFVYGPDVEGVHLRFSAVARGGIRWSDRALDYRTEVLGLVKAQQVKNSIIVPGGAKGGFYPHKLPISTDRAVVGEAARQAYIVYVSTMLSITDNIVQGMLVPPTHVIRHDGDDPYFVVAADKGTATFSDTANSISASCNFWLDDAFASGGSAGYDHKGMGITAKGAWEAVKRNFRELMNRDIQQENFTAVGVGDMSGDVFGNGMLLSDKTRLIAAFDHRDIFIDPNPESISSHAERERLFNLPRSSWQDYDKSNLSKGGDIYSRSSKTITLSDEAAAAIGFEKKTGTPSEIISTILKAQVDLLWFGGIGTYIRGSSESDIQVGDRANDAIRVTGQDIRATIIGEGANLGMTQRGRIEYSMNGGRCETDAIDNSAGVNCSDVEVNIKIALAAAMQKNKLTREERNKLLKSMTDDVSKLVLRNNYMQPLTLSLTEAKSVQDLPNQIRFMNDLERKNLLDRRVEILPDDQALNDRLIQGKGLTRPELSVIMAYAKITLQEELTHGHIIDDKYFHSTLFNYFPPAMREKYREEIEHHRLHRDIVATMLANDIVNRGGITFVSRLIEKTDKSLEDIVYSYIAVRDGFELSVLYEKIDALDNKMSGTQQNMFYQTIMDTLFTTVSWVLRNLDLNKPLDELVASIRSAYHAIDGDLKTILPETMSVVLQDQINDFVTSGAPESLAKQMATLSIATISPNIMLIAEQSQYDLLKTANVYFNLVNLFKISKIKQASQSIPVVDFYDAMALDEANERIASAIRTIIVHVLKTYKNEPDPITAWLNEQGESVQNIIDRMSALVEGDLNISRFTVAASMIAQLA